ncbi:MAG: response regulator, partial [Gammaproteobacteria bacterium]|nr:response regulator [Gammaproteobacteria bacterium]
SRHLLTDKLRQSKDLLKQAQKIGHLGDWHWNTTTNKLTWSDEVYRIYDYQYDNHTPDISEYFKIEFEEDNERLNLFNNIQDKTNASYQIDHRVRTQKNNIRWLHEECIGTYDDTGKLLEVNGIVQDITNAHNRKEQEVHDNKMDAIGQLTSGIAHDFGNLMTVAKGNLELLNESFSKQDNIDTESTELLEDARSAVNDSVKLTRQLLAFSRKKSIAPKYINIKKTINKIKNLLKYTLGGRIIMSTNIDKGLPDILVDPTQFESSLLNIVINARDAMPDGGKIHIRAEIVTIDDSQEVIHNTDNDLGSKCVCIYVKDNGVGMNNDVLEHAIEPFYTTGKQQGTGLGLSMVYGFIKQSGGELIIHSQPGKGSSIYMQFPIYDGKATKPSKKETVELLNDTEATILIVEDQHKVRQYAVRCLNKPGITILEAKDAATARELLKSNHVDLLFTDILMPGDMNGNELADWVSREYPDIKILLTTAMDKSIIKKEGDTEQPPAKHLFKLLPKPYGK